MTRTGPGHPGSASSTGAAPPAHGRGGTRSKTQLVALLTIVAGVGVTAAVLWAARDQLAGGPTLCPIRSLTGLYCPGCGSTRAAAAFLHGDFMEAIGFNPLAALAAPLVAYASLKQAARMATGVSLPRRHVPARYIWGVLTLVLAYTVLRNLPWFPFELLAP